MVALNCGMLTLGTTDGPLLSRLYYSKGGHRQWLSAWLETGGWPLLLFPVSFSYLARRARDGPGAPVVLTRPRTLMAAAALGLATGADDFIYAYGLSYLPVSTSAILISTQLAFTVFFAFLVVLQRLTAFSVNAVVLGLHASSPPSTPPPSSPQRPRLRTSSREIGQRGLERARAAAMGENRRKIGRRAASFPPAAVWALIGFGALPRSLFGSKFMQIPIGHG